LVPDLFFFRIRGGEEDAERESWRDLKFVPKFENVRLIELRVVEQATASCLWEVELSQYQRQELDARICGNNRAGSEVPSESPRGRHGERTYSTLRLIARCRRRSGRWTRVRMFGRIRGSFDKLGLMSRTRRRVRRSGVRVSGIGSGSTRMRCGHSEGTHLRRVAWVPAARTREVGSSLFQLKFRSFDKNMNHHFRDDVLGFYSYPQGGVDGVA